MGIANFPFPSFTLVLTSDRVVIPGPSFVIRLAPLVVLHPQCPQAPALTTNIDLSDDLLDEIYPLANLNFENDSDSIIDVALGHSDPEESRSTDEARTVQTQVGNKVSFSFLKIRPSAARFRLKNIFKTTLLNRKP